MAWARDGGDKDHKNFVNHFYIDSKGKPKGDVWNRAIKADFLEVKKELIDWINQISGQTKLDYQKLNNEAIGVHKDALDIFKRLENLPSWDSEKKRHIYFYEFLANPKIAELKKIMDTWMAIWFWPTNKIDLIPKPYDFSSTGPEATAVTEATRNKHRFFHWELEFPDVFTNIGAGFDAVLGNPPWEILKPSSKEYFSNIDPLYLGYDKKSALKKQKEYFKNSQFEKDWLAYLDFFKAFSNFVKNASNPYGINEIEDKSQKISISEVNAKKWQRIIESRVSISSKDYPYLHQGSADLNTYKLFLELSMKILSKAGRLGLIVPSSIIADKGGRQIRKQLIHNFRWEWVFSFDNRAKIFNIHSSFKFCVIIAQKGLSTNIINTAFMRFNLQDWESLGDFVYDYSIDSIYKFAPENLSLTEIGNKREIEILNKITTTGILYKDLVLKFKTIQYYREFDMTIDNSKFIPIENAEIDNYIQDELGYWIKGLWKDNDNTGSKDNVLYSLDFEKYIQMSDISSVCIPLYQGVMINQYNPFAAEYMYGNNNKAKWQKTPSGYSKIPRPQYLVPLASAQQHLKFAIQPRVVYRAIQNAANERTLISSIVPSVVSGNSIANISTGSVINDLKLICCLNSLVFDSIIRPKINQNNVSFFYIEDSYFLSFENIPNKVALMAAKLNLIGDVFEASWQNLITHFSDLNEMQIDKITAMSEYERIRLRVNIDACMFYLYKLSYDDALYILRDCDYDIKKLERGFSKMLNIKGFWRIDKKLEPELRYPNLVLYALRDLSNLGIDAFLDLNDGKGWDFPEVIRMSDYHLHNSSNSSEYREIRSFYIDKSANTSKIPDDYHNRHTKNIALQMDSMLRRSAPTAPLKAESKDDALLDVDLFGNPVNFPKRHK